jgi:hypothetical protein
MDKAASLLTSFSIAQEVINVNKIVEQNSLIAKPWMI